MCGSRGQEQWGGRIWAGETYIRRVPFEWTVSFTQNFVHTHWAISFLWQERIDPEPKLASESSQDLTKVYLPPRLTASLYCLALPLPFPSLASS